MARLEFSDKHNIVAYLEKSEGSEEFHQIIDFLSGSHIKYALTESPTLYVSLLEEFWQTAAFCTIEDGVRAITATIDRKVKILITEASIRIHLKLNDSACLPNLPNAETFEQLARMDPKKTSWEQFSSNIATAIICLATNRTFKFIFDAMRRLPQESPLQSVHSLGRDEGCLSLHELTVLCITLSNKVAGLESELKQTKETYNAAITKLIKKVEILEQTVKISKSRRRARIVLSEKEEATEDSPKQGRKIFEINEDLNISLMQDEGMTWDQEKASDDTELVLQEDAPTELVEDQGIGEKGQLEITTANIRVSTASATQVSTAGTRVSTASATQVSTAGRIIYTRRSAEKRKDKGKAIMTEPEPPKKLKKRFQEQQKKYDFETTLELEKQMDKREEVVDKAQKIDWNDPSMLRYHALKNKPVFITQARKNMITYLKNQGGYTMQYFKGMSYDDIRPIFEKVWNQIHDFRPMDSELEVQRKGQEVQKEQVKEEIVQQKDVVTEQVEMESSKKAKGSLKRKTSEERMDITKKQRIDKQDQ
ncbi:hypothetical protein Tco_0188992 [Tanacetum coccineum]